MSTDRALERAIQALRTGDRETARALLHELTQAQPLKPENWLWLAAAHEDPRQKRVCLQQVLALDPEDQRAAAGLRALDQQPSNTTPPLPANPTSTEPAMQAASPAPETKRLAQPRFTTTGKRERQIAWPIVALVGALVILIPLAIWLFVQAQTAAGSAILLLLESAAMRWTIDVALSDTEVDPYS